MTSLRIDYPKVAPGAVRGMFATNTYLDDCSIGQVLRRLVELRVSQMNGCTYCIWLHGRQLCDLGEAEARIAALAEWRSANLFDDAERAALEWAEAVTEIAAEAPSDSLYQDASGAFRRSPDC